MVDHAGVSAVLSGAYLGRCVRQLQPHIRCICMSQVVIDLYRSHVGACRIGGAHSGSHACPLLLLFVLQCAEQLVVVPQPSLSQLARGQRDGLHTALFASL